jgi:hypothetical protein
MKMKRKEAFKGAKVLGIAMLVLIAVYFALISCDTGQPATSFKGKLTDSVIVGIFTQEMNLPLELRKMKEEEFIEREQTRQDDLPENETPKGFLPP